MKVSGLKVWFDTELDPTLEQEAAIKLLPGFEEFDQWGETLKVIFWLTDVSQIQTTQETLARTLGVLL